MLTASLNNKPKTMLNKGLTIKNTKILDLRLGKGIVDNDPDHI
ncbi:MAG: hypothetical protein Sw2LagTSB_13050 [Shewanella algae]